MYVAITCCIMTCSISKSFVTYRGSMECEINYNYNQGGSSTTRLTLRQAGNLSRGQQTLLVKSSKGQKKVIEHKNALWTFSTTFVWNISHSKKNSARQCHEHTHVFKEGTLYSSQILMKPVFFQQIFEEYSNIKFNENLSSRTHAGRQRDRHDEANGHFSQFFKRT